MLRIGLGTVFFWCGVLEFFPGSAGLPEARCVVASVSFPGKAFIQFPYTSTLGGQYIIENVVLVGAGPAILAL